MTIKYNEKGGFEEVVVPQNEDDQSVATTSSYQYFYYYTRHHAMAFAAFEGDTADSLYKIQMSGRLTTTDADWIDVQAETTILAADTFADHNYNINTYAPYYRVGIKESAVGGTVHFTFHSK